MATVNITATEEWVKLANTDKHTVLVSWRGQSYVEFAITDADAAPPARLRGHLLSNKQAMTRAYIGQGYLWARSESREAILTVSAS